MFPFPLFSSRRSPAVSSRRPARGRGGPDVLPAGSRRRRGVAFVYTALGLVVALMLAAVVIDIGLLYQRKAKMQRAADAAALAGAQRLAHFKTEYEAKIFAAYIAGLPQNGSYTDLQKGDFKQDGKWYDGYHYEDKNGGTFRITYPGVDSEGVAHNNWFTVSITKPQPSLFGGFWPLNRSSYGVSASATALFERKANLEIKGKGTYGVAPGPVNLSLFGPDGKYSYGDCYSTQWLDDARTEANPDYNPEGYNFLINVPADQGLTSVELFDPDCYNQDGKADASPATTTPPWPGTVDEYRSHTGGGNASNATTTQYTLYYDNGTADPSDDVEIGSRTYGNDEATDMRWNSAFEFDRNDDRYKDGNFRLNVKALSGASENGFDLRAGPKRTSTQPFKPDNGTSIQAEGHLPINFNEQGTTKMTLGTVPRGAAGGQLIIRKFDTDINSTSIVYTCDQLPGKEWTGRLAADGTSETDTINIPDSYKDAAADGVWYAEYVAGNQDTSIWDMSFTGNAPGRPGKIRLVQ